MTMWMDKGQTTPIIEISHKLRLYGANWLGFYSGSDTIHLQGSFESTFLIDETKCRKVWQKCTLWLSVGGYAKWGAIDILIKYVLPLRRVNTLSYCKEYIWQIRLGIDYGWVCGAGFSVSSGCDILLLWTYIFPSGQIHFTIRLTN